MRLRTATIATLCTTLAAGLAFSTDAGQSVVAGAPAPKASAPDEAGVQHDLAAYKGNIVVLEWTNPDCPYVARHYRADTMEKLSSAYAENEVTWIAVNSTRYNTPEDTREWRTAQGFDYPTLQDAKGEVGQSFGARTTPHMFVIDPEGVVAYSGAIDDDPRGSSATPRNYVAEALDALVAGKTPEVSSTKPYGCSVKYTSK